MKMLDGMLKLVGLRLVHMQRFVKDFIIASNSYYLRFIPGAEI